MIETLSIDIETFSDQNLGECGVYRYSESPDAELLLFGYAVNGGEVNVIDVASGELIPEEILAALSDDRVIKWAFNANFERVFLSVWLKRNYPKHFISYDSPEDNTSNYLNPFSWRCSAVWSAYLGLPLSLEGVGAVLNLEDQKLKEGKDLIRYFCSPCSPTKSNGGRTRNLPADAPDKWALFRKYNRRDVEVEMAIHKKLSRFPVPDRIWEEYQIDQNINDRGIALDMDIVNNAIKFDAFSKTALIASMKSLTDLENPNSVSQIKQWLENKGIKAESLDKKAIQALLNTVPSDVAEVLKLRQQLAKSSVKKYKAMENCVCADGRARGMFQFYGANRTGRWAGRLVQLQNLPQNHLSDLDIPRDILKEGDYEWMSILYDNIPDVLSQLVRTAFIAKPGNKFCVADFSSIEARVLAHLAQEQWRIDAFQNGKDIYCESASQMFHVPVEKHGQNSHLRQKGKIAELALGYGGSVGALQAMGAMEMGIPEEELLPLVNAWRASSPNIVKLWWDVDQAVRDVINMRVTRSTHGLKFQLLSGILFITLPSGRQLSYVKPRIEETMPGRFSVTYEGVGTAKKWERLESYGPKFVENIVQAISRDILCYAMRTLSHLSIVAHVHDELIIECPQEISVNDICTQMSQTPEWIPGLFLQADGYETLYYN